MTGGEKMGKKKQEEGMVMVEAIYVVVIAIMMIFFLMNVGFVYYNRMVATAVADEAAASIANNYGYTGREPFYSYVGPQSIRGRDPYRHMGLIKQVRLSKSAAGKGKWYASYLLSELEWTSEKRSGFDDVAVECKTNEMGWNTVTVKINTSYPAFVLNPMTFFGINPRYDVQATGTAVCYDPIHQLNATAFVYEMEKKLMSATKTAKGLTSFIDIFYTIADIITGGK